MKKAFILLLCISLLLCVCSCADTTPPDTPSNVADASGVSDASLDESSDGISDEPSKDISDEASQEPSNDHSDVPSDDSSNDNTSNEDERYKFKTYRKSYILYDEKIPWHYICISAYGPKSSYFDLQKKEYPERDADYLYPSAKDFYYLVSADGYAILDFPFKHFEYKYRFQGMYPSTPSSYFVSDKYDLFVWKFDNTVWGVKITDYVKGAVELTEIKYDKEQINFPDGRVVEFWSLPYSEIKFGGATSDELHGRYINNSLYTRYNPFDTVYNKLAIDYDLPGLLTDEQKAEVKKIRDDYDKTAHYTGDESNAEERLQKMQLPAEYYVFEYLKGEGITLEQILEAVDYYFSVFDLIYEDETARYGDMPNFEQVINYFCDPKQNYNHIDINKHYAKIIYEGDADKIRSEVAPISSFNVDGTVYPVSWLKTHPELLDDFAKRGYLEPVLEFYRMAFDADTYEELNSDATNYYYEYIKAYERYCGTK